MTLIMTWLFEKCNIIILGYSGVQSLISLKVRIQFWVYRLCRGNLCDECFLRFTSQCRGLRCREVSSQELIVLFIADRKSQIANHRSRDCRSQDRRSRFSFNHCMLLMRRCDMRRRISAIRASLGFLFKSALNICDAMDFASLLCSLFMRIGKRFTLSSRCDIAFRELNTKILIKIFFGFFCEGSPFAWCYC